MRISKRIYSLVVIAGLSTSLLTAGNSIKQFLADFTRLGGQVVMLEEDSNYLRAQLNDSITLEMYDCPPDLCDKWFVVMTVCAPQCSSCARVYNKEGKYLFPLDPPGNSIFPYATIDKTSGRIIWSDNDDWDYSGSPK
ncbi:MAG: DUF3256 family protein [Paludibacteraceae bacterium]|nr:DUF3256 family protein [Paludibacteraceae bacterium]